MTTIYCSRHSIKARMAVKPGNIKTPAGTGRGSGTWGQYLVMGKGKEME